MASKTSECHNPFSALEISDSVDSSSASALSISSSSQPSIHDYVSDTSYVSDSEETESDESVCDYSSDNEPEHWTLKKVDLHDWYTSITNKKPVYTQERLQQCLEDRDRILSDNTCEKITRPDFLTGKDRVIFTREDFDAEEKEPVVAVNFLTAVEMHPDSHKVPHCNRSNSIRPLHYMNGTTRKYEHIFAPISFDIYCRTPSSIRKDIPTMNWWRNTLRAARNAWKKSPARLHLGSMFGWSSNTHIDRLVCFGLGNILHRNWKLIEGNCILQHFAVFDMAALFNKMRREENPNTPPVEVCLQDPTYRELDRILLREIFEVDCPGGKLSFLKDPESYLKIDQHAIVVGPYLPLVAPYIQICADLGQCANEGDGNTWPAGFIFDLRREDVKPSKKFWKGRNRLSPRAFEMLAHYRSVNDFEGNEDGQNLRDALNLNDHPFWLSLMDIRMKK